jgi:CRISPR-associated protein Cmr3
VTTVSIEPLALLMFRDGKPFSAGDDHLARSIFPPHPITVAGFLRALLFEAAGSSWEEVTRRFGSTGDSNCYGEFGLTRLLLLKDGGFFVPTPGALVVNKRSPEAIFILRPLREAPLKASTNMPDPNLTVLWPSTHGVVEAARGFVALAQLRRYLIDGQPPPNVYSEHCFALREPRSQIAIDTARRSVAEPHLYTVHYLRLNQGVAIVASFEGISWPVETGSRISRMGGEGRLVRLRTIDCPQTDDRDSIVRAISNRGRFKLVLLTPAIFQPGWRPGERVCSLFKAAGVSAALVGAAVNRSLPIGGFDLRNQRPKPMRSAVPAGSVYFYEIKNGDPHRLVQEFHLKPVSDEHWEAGMGIAALGVWDYTDLGTP